MHTCVCVYLLLILFLWRTLTDTMMVKKTVVGLKADNFLPGLQTFFFFFSIKPIFLFGYNFKLTENFQELR